MDADLRDLERAARDEHATVADRVRYFQALVRAGEQAFWPQGRVCPRALSQGSGHCAKVSCELCNGTERLQGDRARLPILVCEKHEETLMPAREPPPPVSSESSFPFFTHFYPVRHFFAPTYVVPALDYCTRRRQGIPAAKHVVPSSCYLARCRVTGTHEMAYLPYEWPWTVIGPLPRPERPGRAFHAVDAQRKREIREMREVLDELAKTLPPLPRVELVRGR